MQRDVQPLIDRYLDGQASVADVDELNALLRADGQARRQLIELANLDSALAAITADLAPDGPARNLAPDRVAGDAAPKTILGWSLAIAASLLCLAYGAWRAAATQSYATVVETAGVEDLAAGAMLQGAWREIKTGSAELVTARGAKVVIEAPARFRFESASRLHLTRGRLSAEVPPSAKGFTVLTPTGEAVDLGTKFGVDAAGPGSAEVHVFQGEVIAQSLDGKRRSLRDGEAFRLDSGAGTLRELRSAAFIRPDEVGSLHAALAAGQRARSDAAREALRGDPALVALLDFEADEAPSGVYRIVQGRWPGSRAAEFLNVGDHMKLDVGGDRSWPQLTLSAWARLDRLGEPYQSLLHTDGWDKSNPGQVHWMITRGATMRLALFGNSLAQGSITPEADSRTPVLAEQGRWLNLTTVYDSERRTTRFYLNGEFDSETKQEIAHPARLGPAQVGNWNRKDRKLSGRIDELAIFGRALNDDEVRALFAAGDPYR